MSKNITSFDIAAVIAELKRMLETGKARINNIYQLDRKTLILKIKSPGGQPLNLLVEAGKRLHLTSYRTEKPLKPPSFCMALRKHLRNGVVFDVSQREFERTVEVSINKGQGNYKLVIELFGEGNIILVEPNGRILQALTYRRMRDRNVVRGEEFKFAPSSGLNPLKANKEEVKENLKMMTIEVVRALTRLFSIGGFYAEEILLRTGIDKKTPCNKLSEEELNKILTEIHSLASKVASGSLEPAIIFDKDGKQIDVVPVKLRKYEGYKRKEFRSFNEALDEFYMKESLKKKEEKVSEEIRRRIEELHRRLKGQTEALNRIKAEKEENRKIGDLIYAHFHELQEVIQKIEELRKSSREWNRKALETLTPSVKILKVDLKKLFATLKIGGETFSLNLRHSIQENAAKYYSEAKKAEKKIKGALQSIEETKKRIKELEKDLAKAIVEEGEKAKIPAKIRRRAWYEKFRWFYSSEGFLVIGGKDAATNELLIKRYTEPHDVVFHADIAGAPFVIVKTEGKKPSIATLNEAAQFAASFSKAWKMGLGALDVYWVKPEQVSKAAPSGEYLRRGAFVIRGERNYVRRVPLKVAIGINLKNDEIVVVGGPPEAVAKQTVVYVEIVPGDTPSGKLAKMIRGILAEKVHEEKRREVLGISVEEIQQFIPSGKGRIVRK